LFTARTIEIVSRHDFFGIEIAIGIVIEVPLSAHTGSNNTGTYGLSTTRSASVRPLDYDIDPDPDIENHVRCNHARGVVLRAKQPR
jgi:hypothetical protein